MRATQVLRRTIDRFFDNPGSIRTAAWLIVGATLTAVVGGGVAVRLLDHREYPNLGRALWFTLQTVTTVGYGDVTPTRVVGRLVGAVVMLTGIGFITIVTAAITSTFVEASRRRAATAADSAETRPGNGAGDLAAITARLDKIDETLSVLVEQSRPR
jgi:voltage-gated potassium channel